MYQSQFGLSRRPFSSTPDPTCVVPVGGMPEAISELEHCAQDGQGLGILTSPAGLGKTILCRKLAESLRDQFAVVFLPNANFPTRRSLLQAMLYEMGHPYLRLGEQELRLEFTTAVRDLHPDREGLVVIVDEAHLLHNRLLEELRTATHLVHQGEMLVRVILSGQLELEERLVRKDLAAINQRIVCHVTLSPLSMLESQEYLEQRVEWAGGTLSDIFTPDAVRMICQASDGNPRCLNQLADHALMLAGASKLPKVEPAHVLEALEELKQLPLHWNHVELPKSPGGNSTRIVEIASDTPPLVDEDTEEAETACIEFGAPLDEDEIEPTAAEQQCRESEDVDSEPLSSENDETGVGMELITESAEIAETDAEVVTEDTDEAEAWELGELYAEMSEDDEEIVEVSVKAQVLDTLETQHAASATVDLWMETEHDFAEEAVQDHYAQLDRGLMPELVQQQPRDWENWDPVQELRNEEAAFAAPPFPPREPEITIINAIPEAGQEWQPEDLNLPKRQAMTSDPSELIDRVMPLIDAALHGDFSELDEDSDADVQTSFLNQFKVSSPEPVSDPVGEPFLAEASLAGQWAPTEERDEIAWLMNQQFPVEIGNSSEESHEYVTLPQSESSFQDLEEQIAQTVLDTYNDVQPLLWSSTTDSESDAPIEPPPVAPGEEPIRDPGDATPFDELREALEQAIEASTQAADEQPSGPAEPKPPAPPSVKDEPTDKPHRSQMEYDIVLPESDEETEMGPSNNTNADQRENRAPQRPHSTRNLFSKIRRKEQA